jgi:hypothetical protein
MSRRRPDYQTLDLASWPTLAWAEFDAAERSRLQTHIDAIERYTSGEPVGSIETATRINRKQLYRFLDRTLSPHVDGRIYGFSDRRPKTGVDDLTSFLVTTLLRSTRTAASEPRQVPPRPGLSGLLASRRSCRFVRACGDNPRYHRKARLQNLVFVAVCFGGEIEIRRVFMDASLAH